MRSRLLAMSLLVLLGLTILNSAAPAFQPVTSSEDTGIGSSSASAQPRGRSQDGGDPDGVGLDKPRGSAPGALPDAPETSEVRPGPDPPAYYQLLLRLIVGLTL
jgi:hypothetical protein